MKIKRLIAAGLSTAMILTLAACGGTPAASGDAAAPAGKPETVTLYATGSDNVRTAFEKLTTDFNENSTYKDKYQVKLQFILAGTGGQNMRDMLVAAYKAGQTETDFDLVDLGDQEMPVCLNEGGPDMFVPLSEVSIPNAKDVAAKSVVGPEYFQPYRGTTVVLAYNSDAVPTVPKTMDELVTWIKANPTRFAYNAAGTGGAGDSFIRTCIYNQIPDQAALMSADPKWMEQWDAGFEFMKDIHPSLYKSGSTIMYPNKNQGTLDLLISKEIDMCPAWADMVLSQRRAGTLPESVKIATITPSFTGAVQTLGIPAMGSHKEGAAAFIDYMLSVEAQKILVDDMAAIPLIDTAKLDLTGVEDLATLDVSAFRTQSIGDLTTEVNKRWDAEIGSIG